MAFSSCSSTDTAIQSWLFWPHRERERERDHCVINRYSLYMFDWRTHLIVFVTMTTAAGSSGWCAHTTCKFLCLFLSSLKLDLQTCVQSAIPLEVTGEEKTSSFTACAECKAARLVTNTDSTTVACQVYFITCYTGSTSPNESSTSLLLRFAGVWRTKLRCDVLELLSDHCNTPVTAVSSRHLRSSNRHQLTVPRCRRITFGHRAFSVAGPMVWNSLPTEFRDLSIGFGVFRRTVKTIPFARYWWIQRNRDLYAWYCAAQISLFLFVSICLS